MKDKLVIFSSNTARVESDPARIAKYKDRPNTLLNPDMGAVKGVPLSMWVMKNGKIATRTFTPGSRMDLIWSAHKKFANQAFGEVKFEPMVAWTAIGGLLTHLFHVWGFLK